MTKKQLKKELKFTEENLTMVMKESRAYSRELKSAVKDLVARDAQYQELRAGYEKMTIAYQNAKEDGKFWKKTYIELRTAVDEHDRQVKDIMAS